MLSTHKRQARKTCLEWSPNQRRCTRGSITLL